MHIIRLLLSIDHQKKKTYGLNLPFFIYLHFVTSKEFETVLPEGLQEKCLTAKKHFYQENKFFSEEYMVDYKRSPYIRFLTGPDVHKFFAKLLSLNYQPHRHLLRENAGSFTEFFADLDLFWADKYRKKGDGIDEQTLRDVLFCQACLQTHYQRIFDKKNLRDKLDDFAKSELIAREEEIAVLRQEMADLKRHLKRKEHHCKTLQQQLDQAQEEKIVLVPGDPHHMLGLASDEKGRVEKRAKALLKALHPDKSGTSETAYLFDLIVKSRDLALKD
ncbi:MAG: hypothetical protein HWE30_02915 [Methylocystaceae bacterium]|nr:hypothetical protein [Methylocystaceae bacterium]